MTDSSITENDVKNETEVESQIDVCDSNCPDEDLNTFMNRFCDFSSVIKSSLTTLFHKGKIQNELNFCYFFIQLSQNFSSQKTLNVLL